MAAIRRERYEVAEYLIDQLAVNVKYAATFREFRSNTKMPIRQRKFSCRDLAYEKGMMEVVDLIDITNDEVTSSSKRYIQKRIQPRLDNMQRTYIKRIQERDKNLLFQTDEIEEERKEIDRDENFEASTPNMNDEKNTIVTMLPNIQRPRKSYVEEAIQNIDTKTEKSIDETGKKTFRFSNYSLRFRLVDTIDSNRDVNERSQTKTSIPSLPVIPLTTSSSRLSTITNDNSRSISEISTRFSMRDACPSVIHSDQRMSIPKIVSIEHKPLIKIKSKRTLPTRIDHKHIKYSYNTQQPYPVYKSPGTYVPVTLKATAIGLPSHTRILRD